MSLKEDVLAVMGVAYALSDDMSAVSNEYLHNLFSSFDDTEGIIIKLSVILSKIMPREDFQKFCVDWLLEDDE